MRQILIGVLLVIAVFSAAAAFAQQLLPVPVDSSDLITPVNVQPLSIESVARRRGLLMGEPTRNLIVFSSTGITGASAALYEACVPRRRIHSQWQGLENIYPSMTRSGKGSVGSLIQMMSGMGRRLGLVSDYDFILPGFIQNEAKQKTVDLGMFNMALSFSDSQDEQERAQIINSALGSGLPAALSFVELERLFAQKSSKIVGCFYRPDQTLEATSIRHPGLAELVSLTVSRLSAAREGFFLAVNYRAVAEARNKNSFWQMLEHKKIQDRILQQLATFVYGRRDTLLLVIDEPEAGSWSIGKNFDPQAFVADLKKIPDVLRALKDRPADAAAILGQHFSGVTFSLNELLVALNSGDMQTADFLLGQGLNKAHQVSFTSHKSELANAGMTVFTMGRNAEMFFGLSSFEDFYRRLISCIRIAAE